MSVDFKNCETNFFHLLLQFDSDSDLFFMNEINVNICGCSMLLDNDMFTMLRTIGQMSHLAFICEVNIFGSSILDMWHSNFSLDSAFDDSV